MSATPTPSRRSPEPAESVPEPRDPVLTKLIDRFANAHFVAGFEAGKHDAGETYTPIDHEEAEHALRQHIARALASRPASLGGAETALLAARDAWREFAQHQEWCRCCGEDGVKQCDTGAPLQQAAEDADAALSRRPEEDVRNG